MVREITLGQYYQSDSVIHRLDPRVKILGTVAFVVSLFLSDYFLGYGVAIIFLALCIRISTVPFKYIVRGMKMIVVLALVAVFFNLFFTDGEHILWKWWILRLSREGILRAVFFAFRLVLVIVGSSLLTYTTTPTTLTNGMEKVLSPLRKIHFPAHELAMMMTIALRFIPTLMEETDRIIKAQTARGADFAGGNLLARAKNMLPILVPLFISAFRRADDLAVAMEARCYRGGEGRTRMHQLAYRSGDVAAFLFAFAMIGALAFLRWGALLIK